MALLWAPLHHSSFASASHQQEYISLRKWLQTSVPGVLATGCRDMCDALDACSSQGCRYLPSDLFSMTPIVTQPGQPLVLCSGQTCRLFRGCVLAIAQSMEPTDVAKHLSMCWLSAAEVASLRNLRALFMATTYNRERDIMVAVLIPSHLLRLVLVPQAVPVVGVLGLGVIRKSSLRRALVHSLFKELRECTPDPDALAAQLRWGALAQPTSDQDPGPPAPVHGLAGPATYLLAPLLDRAIEQDHSVEAPQSVTAADAPGQESLFEGQRNEHPIAQEPAAAIHGGLPNPRHRQGMDDEQRRELSQQRRWLQTTINSFWMMASALAPRFTYRVRKLRCKYVPHCTWC
ncbi:hypothetical protein QJQ45_028302 [Haematococcus lacustris]|nr:hypothetical protein QJQ45_028302 [Haematococcus lacustris]